jgi:hypothetical protein
MTTAYKVLAQNAPAATTHTTLYTVPLGNSAVVSTLAICNQGNTTTYRVAVQPSGENTVLAKHYIVYDSYVNGLDSVFLTLGLSLAANDSVRVYSGTPNIAFNLYGSEIY